MDRASLSLDHIKHSGEYVCIPDFVVFDEHDEFDRNGKLIRRFDRAKLQRIADRCNARQMQSGDLAVIAPGHSLDNPKSEEDQPPPWGFGADFRVGTYGPEGKTGILCSAYIQKHIRTKDGQVVDGPDYVRTFPRRSPEVWPNHPAIPEHARDTIDWIALLRRAPQRDLGLAVYQRSYDARQEVIACTNRTGKIRYQMESPMPDPVAPPAAADSANLDATNAAEPGGDTGGPPEGHEEFAKHLDYAMMHHPHLKHVAAMCKAGKYGMDEGADPALPDGGMPAPDGGAGGADDGVMRNQRGADVQPTKVQRDLASQKKRLDAWEKELAIGRQQQRLAKYEMALKELANEYTFDVPEELKDVAGLDEKGFEKHLGRIRKNYSRTPVGGDLPYEAVTETNPAAVNLNDPGVGEKVLRYMNDHPELLQKHGEGAFKEAARILKFI